VTGNIILSLSDASSSFFREVGVEMFQHGVDVLKAVLNTPENGFNPLWEVTDLPCFQTQLDDQLLFFNLELFCHNGIRPAMAAEHFVIAGEGNV